jgi:uncharacterized membrane protein YdbT with pleckstrin-like domain
MSYAESLLANGEQIQYRGRQHWLAPLSDARNAVLILLVGLVLALIEHQVLHWGLRSIVGLIDLVLVVVALVWIGIVYFSWRAEEYIITNRRVLKVEGLLDKKAGDSSLDKINDAVLKQGVLARMLRYGDLEVLTANEEAIDRYRMLSHVVDFKKAMLNAKNDLEDGVRRPGTSNAAGTAPVTTQGGSDDVTATLQKLADLRDKGAITPAEYEAKKAELLGRI